MKIYTRGGDKGQTSLLGGQRVGKDHQRIEAYGTIDELNSHLGMLRDLAGDHQRELIISMQERLFQIGSLLASADAQDAERFKVPPIVDADVAALEVAIDAMEKDLPPMRNFILPGGHPAVSQAHICRTVCRRAERIVVRIREQEMIPEVIVHYLNRSSDLLFVMARWLGRTFGAEERPWTPRG